MIKNLHLEVIKLRLSQHIIHELTKKKQLKIHPHMAFGLEIMPVIIKALFRNGDKIFFTHRNISYNLSFLKNNLKPILDELNLKKTGVNNGKIGSMNMENKSRGVVYSSSILGNNLSVSLGSAATIKFLNKKKSITYVITGDGAIEEGSFYETLLLAKYLKLRLIIVVENNNFSMASKINERRDEIDLKKLTMSLGIGYKFLNNNDVLSQYFFLKKIRNQVFQKSQPFVIETKVTMFNAHYGATQKNNFSTNDISLDNDLVIKKNLTDPVFISYKKLSKNILNKFLHFKLNIINKYLS
jgi:pyruvate dehydrogenase E1 component alpha subunit